MDFVYFIISFRFSIADVHSQKAVSNEPWRHSKAVYEFHSPQRRRAPNENIFLMLKSRNVEIYFAELADKATESVCCKVYTLALSED